MIAEVKYLGGQKIGGRRILATKSWEVDLETPDWPAEPRPACRARFARGRLTCQTSAAVPFAGEAGRIIGMRPIRAGYVGSEAALLPGWWPPCHDAPS